MSGVPVGATATSAAPAVSVKLYMSLKGWHDFLQEQKEVCYLSDDEEKKLWDYECAERMRKQHPTSFTSKGKPSRSTTASNRTSNVIDSHHTQLLNRQLEQKRNQVRSDLSGVPLSLLSSCNIQVGEEEFQSSRCSSEEVRLEVGLARELRKTRDVFNDPCVTRNGDRLEFDLEMLCKLCKLSLPSGVKRYSRPLNLSECEQVRRHDREKLQRWKAKVAAGETNQPFLSDDSDSERNLLLVQNGRLFQQLVCSDAREATTNSSEEDGEDVTD